MLSFKGKITTNVREKEDAEEIIKMYWNEKYAEMIEYVESLKYKYDGEYAEKYIEEIENNIRKMKRSKNSKKAPRDASALKRGCIKGHPLIRKILDNKEMSELIYR